MTTGLAREDECASIQPEVIATLIHGTFAQGASWVGPGSTFRAGLESAFGSRIAFHLFKWSGDNSVFARKEAGDKLAEHVRAITTAHPGVRQILIAHSHGGNIALYALREVRVDGVACIATPFLHAGLRDVRIFDEKTLKGAFFGLWCLGTFLIVPFISFGFWEWIATTISTVVGILISAVSAAFLAAGFLAFREFAANFAQQIDCHPDPSTNLFIARKVGDEASLALGAGELFFWATTKVFARVSAKVLELDPRPLRSFTGRPLPKAVLALWLIFFIGIIAFPSEELPPALPAFVKFLAFLAATATLLVKTTWLDRALYGAALLGLLGAASVGVFAFGTNPPRNLFEGSDTRASWLFGIVLALSIEINTEAMPAGGWFVRQFERTTDDCRADSKTLVHSAYDDPRVINDLIWWIAASTGVRDLNRDPF